MAEGSAATEETEQQITFNVKSSAEGKYVLTLPISTTVSDLKQKLSSKEYADIPPERQRLIYSGRVLKDSDTIATCKIKDGMTVHLVKGAESNSRQNPANQGGSAASVPPGAGPATSHVPSNIAAGTGAANPLAQLTGARYAGFHGLPGMDTFGADGGMGAPPNSDQMLRLLEDPNFASQMNEAMNNPAVLDMLRQNPMIRNNPMARQALENPELRRMMMNPDMIRMQMQMQRAMGGGGSDSAFPMPGRTDTTGSDVSGEGGAGGAATTGTSSSTGATGGSTQNQGAAGNPFAALFGGGNARGPGNNGGNAQQNPFPMLFGGASEQQQQQQQQQGGNQPNPLASMTQNLMQNPQLMQQMMQMMGGGGGDAGMNQFNPFMFGGMGGEGGGQAQSAPADTRPPEDRYADQLRQLNDMGFHEFERNVQALRRSGGSVQGAVEYLLSNL